MRPSKRTGRVGYLDFDPAARIPIPRLVVIGGKEHLLADTAIRTLIATIAPDESMRALNVDVVNASGGDEFSAVAEKVAALPFLAERRAVIVRGSIDLKKESRDQLAAVCATVPEHAVLVVDHSGKPARPQGRRPADEAATLARANEDSILIDCTLSERECAEYISRYARAIELKIDPGAIDALASTEDVTEIKNTLDRLALSGRRVTQKDVAEYAMPSEDAKVWTFAAAVWAGDADRALRIASEIGEPIGPLTYLAGDAQIIWELRSGARMNEYVSATGMNFWRVKNLLGLGKDRSQKELRERVDMTMAALERSLTGRRDPQQALEEVIVRLAPRR